MESQYIDGVSQELTQIFMLIDVGTAATMRNSCTILASSLSIAIFILLIPGGKTASHHFQYNHEANGADFQQTFGKIS